MEISEPKSLLLDPWLPEAWLPFPIVLALVGVEATPVWSVSTKSCKFVVLERRWKSAGRDVAALRWRWVGPAASIVLWMAMAEAPHVSCMLWGESAMPCEVVTSQRYQMLMSR